jgi:release factor glutamine methyltransferase
LNKTPTIAQALQYGRDLLILSQQEASLEAEILLGHCLQKTRAQLRARPEILLSDNANDCYQRLLERRRQGEPIAYITGYKEFWDLRLRVTPAVLIPRPETEHLVERALERIPPDARWNIADLGTGSGAVGLAIAKERPHCHMTAVDKSAPSLEIARENAAENCIQNISFQQGSWFSPLGDKRFDMIVANPPYIAENDLHLQQGDLRFEPPEALSAKADGLEDLRHIISCAPAHLAPAGWLLLEHGYQQGASVMALLQENGFLKIQCYADYAQLERVSGGQLTPQRTHTYK